MIFALNYSEEKIEMDMPFLSFLHIEITQEINIFPREKEGLLKRHRYYYFGLFFNVLNPLLVWDHKAVKYIVKKIFFDYDITVSFICLSLQSLCIRINELHGLYSVISVELIFVDDHFSTRLLMGLDIWRQPPDVRSLSNRSKLFRATRGRPAFSKIAHTVRVIARPSQMLLANQDLEYQRYLRNKIYR